MLITFKSRADGDVIMFGEVGQRMLTILGKDPQQERGILTLEQLPAAIAALREAIARDKADNPAPDDEDEWGRDAVELQNLREKQREREQQVSLARRAAPLLIQLEHSLRDNTHVIWEAEA